MGDHGTAGRQRSPQRLRCPRRGVFAAHAEERRLLGRTLLHRHRLSSRLLPHVSHVPRVLPADRFDHVREDHGGRGPDPGGERLAEERNFGSSSLVKAFVTGATGFVGSHVARALQDQGAELRLLVRPSSDLRNIADLNAERVSGDLRDVASFERALDGCHALFHVAADYRLWVRDPDQMYRANVDGTKAILRAAQEAGVRRVVYTSSVATMGFTGNG